MSLTPAADAFFEFAGGVRPRTSTMFRKRHALACRLLEEMAETAFLAPLQTDLQGPGVTTAALRRRPRISFTG